MLFNVGSRFDDRVTGKASTFAPHAKIIHVDVDPSEIGKLVPVTGAASSATRRACCSALLEAVPARDTSSPNVQHWIDEVHALRAKFEPRQAYRRRPDSATLQPHDVCALLNVARQRARAVPHRHRRRPAPDVGGAAARLAPAAHAHHQRRLRHDGLRGARGARRGGRVSRRDHLGDRRRRRLPDDQSGDRDDGAGRADQRARSRS